ncbi:unnamed protein product, partial [marine sediment metagenome]
IKQKKPKFDFKKYGYRHILWQETDPKIIKQLTELFQDKKVYIADGHHRAASAAKYRKIKLNELKVSNDYDAPWQYLLSYVASDDQIRILPYNRVIKRLRMEEKEFLEKLEEIYKITPMKQAFNPENKNHIALCINGKWFKLTVIDKSFKSKRD